MIRLTNFELRRGENLLFKNANFAVHAGQKIGLIGRNGCGKSSLLEALLGSLTIDGGEFTMPENWRIAHLAQETILSDRTIIDFVIDGDKSLRQIEAEIQSAKTSDDCERLAVAFDRLENINGFDANHRAKVLLDGLGFDQSQINLPCNRLSGGWRLRLCLAQTLMRPSELLLLDEPTNHLDINAVLWLEQWLRDYQGVAVVISHDREFLDNVVESIIHIDKLKCQIYAGGYSSFEKVRCEQLSNQAKTFEKQERWRREIQGFIDRFGSKASKARQAQSRLKELKRMKTETAIDIDSPHFFTFFDSEIVASPLVRLDNAYFGYRTNMVLSKVNFSIESGERIAFLGANGSGKSTLLSVLRGSVNLKNGNRVVTKHLQIGYFSQHQIEALDLSASAFEHLKRASPEASDQELRNFLGSFDFSGPKALNPVVSFSGGEKSRLALALIIWLRPNLLLLDEPTNHLDLDVRRALIYALQSYSGALIVVSHDRHLLRNTVDKFYLIEDNRVFLFDGDMKDYENRLRENRISLKTNRLIEDKNSVSRKSNRQNLARERVLTRPLRMEIRQIELEMQDLQERLLEMQKILADPSSYARENQERLRTIVAEEGHLRTHLEQREERWLQLNSEIELM